MYEFTPAQRTSAVRETSHPLQIGSFQGHAVHSNFVNSRTGDGHVQTGLEFHRVPLSASHTFLARWTRVLNTINRRLPLHLKSRLVLSQDARRAWTPSRSP